MAVVRSTGHHLRILIWQWGRRGAGPRYAAELHRAFCLTPATEPLLSFSTRAELLTLKDAPLCTIPVETYTNVLGFAGRVLTAPLMASRLAGRIQHEAVDVALCAMPAALDLVMASALRQVGIPYGVVVHDADLHPGDPFAPQMQLQQWLVRGAKAVFTLSTHVADRLLEQGLVTRDRLYVTLLPPLYYGASLPDPGSHGGRLRLLSFGRLLPYKGLDILADAIALLPGSAELEVRVVGSGPESPELNRLRKMPRVSVENRWVEESEVSKLLGWADGLVLSHREASQSGVAAAAIAARRWVIATRVGGLVEQLGREHRTLFCEPSGQSLADVIMRLAVTDREVPEAPSPTDLAWPSIAHNMVDVLRQLANASTRSSEVA